MDKRFLAYVKENKRIFIIILLVCLGLLLASAATTLGSSEKSTVKEGQTLDEYREKLEGELASLCGGVEGVGKCRVFITFDKGAQNTYKNGTLIETKPPHVSGVTVVCDGGESDRVKSSLTKMITALFGIGSNRVAILKLNR